MISRRTAALAALAGLSFGALGACGDDSSGDGTAPALDESLTNVGVGAWDGVLGVDLTDADPAVPDVEVRLAQAPFWDHSTEQIGIELGYFTDAGITVTPQPSGTILGMDQIAPQLLAGQIDVGTMVPQIWTSSLDQGVTARVFTSRDIFMGHAFLAAPGTGARSVGDFMDDGMSWDDAVVAALEQIVGQTVYVTDEASPRSFREVALEAAGLTTDDFESNVLDDTTMQQLAISGRADFVAPASGPNIVSLIAEGWIPLVSTSDIVEHGNAEQLLTVVVNTGLAAEVSWLQANPETALRLASVGYRIVDLKKTDPEAAAGIQIPFINSIAGTSFTMADAETLDQRIDPFYSFEEQAEFFQDESSPFYWSKPIDATVESLRDAGLLTGEHEASDVSWADSTWLTLDSLREQSGELIDELTAAGGLTGQAAEQLARAEEFFAARNYLDAFRFANAAKLNA
ncbi:ABC transporter substrate-binding protein [Jiangella sp. DSM 45060]|uniref:ABC transporter substrate-binding protein n=1 Tax=Jiangella sp. DSM 45060 TaxID=1798224 RepID=UPI00087B13EC|nr:hypothetical protein [Jiangella sp. DSM 45060]SDS53378.1 ABC-type nitrate/sulfonate/bicarbonate transport system, substrate-binding protein [Jiangella sp. DSM 45060]